MKNATTSRKRWTSFLVVSLVFAFVIVVRLRWYSSSGAILYGGSARALFKQCSRGTPGNVSGYSLASWSAVQHLESGLPAFLSRQKAARGVVGISGYRFQYAGFKRGKRDMIYVNAFPIESDKGSWRFLPVVVCDGGISFFGVEYDVASGQFSHFQSNGPA